MNTAGPGQSPRTARAIAERLAETYPDAHAELDFTTPFELLVATVLSAQSTDVRVNMVTPALFKAYPNATAMASAEPEEIEPLISSVGLFRSKAAALVGLSRRLVEVYDGEVPADLNALVTLPGVGRKTANVVLGNAFGIPGITPDTHLIRLTNRFGWVSSKKPDDVEKAVAKLFPAEDWVMLCHRVIWHGRRCCFARKPACYKCSIEDLCPSSQL